MLLFDWVETSVQALRSQCGNMSLVADKAPGRFTVLPVDEGHLV